METIELLPENIINQIKAGEVAESPALILKELFENAADAGASKIDIHLYQLGLESLVIEDNGQGIPAQDLPLAFTRHATSKIQAVEDLYRLESFGFRGEALASISAVSHTRCWSAVAGEETAQIEVRAGEMGEPIICPQAPLKLGDHGTKIQVQHLFSNTPVRLKFLKSEKKERRRIEFILNALLLSHPEIRVTVNFDNIESRVYPVCTDKAQRFAQITKQQREHIFDWSFEFEQFRYRVLFIEKTIKSNLTKKQFIFVNNRRIEHRSAHYNLVHSLSKLWAPPLSGHYCLFIDIPPAYLDVNLHPNKTTVKILQEEKLLSFISQTLKNKVNTVFPDLKQETNFSPEVKSDQNKLQSPKVSEKMATNEYSHLSTPYIELLDSFIMIQYKQEHYILNLEKLFQFLLIDSLKKDQNEGDLVPVLIARPIQCPGKTPNNLVKMLRSRSWNIEVKNECLYIYGLPMAASFLHYELLMRYWLGLSDTDFDREQDLKKMVPGFKKDFLLTEQCYHMVQYYSLEVFIEKKIMAHLSSKKIHGLFNEI
jgi:DNA mismatch repair protein MutL